MRRSCLPVLMAIALIAWIGCAHGPPSSKRTSIHRVELGELIEQLASNYLPAYEDGEREMLNLNRSIFAEDSPINAAEQDAVRVSQAYGKLWRIGFTAFDQLVAASNDPRHSFSEIYAAWRNHSVGDACFMIIESQVDFYGEGYKSRDGVDGRHSVKPQYLWYVRENQGLEVWWTKRRGRSLADLQIESLVWTIERENEMGFTDDTQRDRILSPLQRRLALLREMSP